MRVSAPKPKGERRASLVRASTSLLKAFLRPTHPTLALFGRELPVSMRTVVAPSVRRGPSGENVVRVGDSSKCHQCRFYNSSHPSVISVGFITP